MIERSFRLEEDVYDQLKEISETENLPVSYLVRLAMAQFLNAYYGSTAVIDMADNA